MSSSSDHIERIRELRQTIRSCLNAAVRDGTIEGEDALGVLVGLSAEMVAGVQDVKLRGDIVCGIVDHFPSMVLIEVEVPEGVTWQ